jgi:hypothetical protein
MNTTLLATFFSLILILLFAGLGRKFGWIRKSYFMGVAIWSQWLPVIATAAYMSLMAANITTRSEFGTHALDLSRYFSIYELILFFLLGPAFLTRRGNVIAALTVAGATAKLLVTGVTIEPSMSLYLFAGSATLVAILGDKMPWHDRSHGVVAAQIREILLIGLTMAALGVTVICFSQIRGFSHWLADSFALNLSREITIIFLAILIFGWLSIALGITRHLTLPMLALPTMFVLAYMTNWPPHLLAVPFAACLALSLSVADRRDNARRN